MLQKREDGNEPCLREKKRESKKEKESVLGIEPGRGKIFEHSVPFKVVPNSDAFVILFVLSFCYSFRLFFGIPL